MLTAEVLARTTGRGIASDLPPTAVKEIVGTEFISYLTPDEISRIDTSQILSEEARDLITRDLLTVIDDEAMFVIDQSTCPSFQPTGTGELQPDIRRGPYAVQVGIFKTSKNALSLLKTLRSDRHYQAYIYQTANNSGKLLYAVRLGDYQNIKEPYIEAAQYKARKKQPAVITYANALNAISAEEWPQIAMTVAELEKTTGKGFATDLSDEELDQTVGSGMITNLTPEQLEKIDASGMLLSTEAIRIKTRYLAKIIARGVTYMVDESKFTAAELEEIKGRGTTIKEIGRLPFSVQAGVYQIRENALSMLKELQQKGYEPYIFQTTDETGKTLFAVRLGDHETVKSAYAEATHFRRKEHKPAVVTYINSLQAVRPKIIEEVETPDTAEGTDEETRMFQPGRQYPSEDLNKLYQELLSLRKEVDQLQAEAKAREKLRLTEAEEEKEEKEILEAVGRDYILSPKGTLSLDYSFGYSYNSYDSIWSTGEDININHTADHSINNTLSASYAWFDNLTLTAAMPFKYKYKDLGGKSSRDITDVGDISVGARWQVTKQTAAMPPLIINLNISTPTGRSPYDINPEKDLSTGSGTWQISLGTALNKTFDPVVVYGTVGVTYALGLSSLDYRTSSGGAVLDEVDDGIGFGLGLGVGYAMSYKASLNASVSYSYALGTTYTYENGNEVDTADTSSASLSVGMGWKMNTQRTISINLGMGLTDATSDFSLSCRIPFDFEL